MKYWLLFTFLLLPFGLFAQPLLTFTEINYHSDTTRDSGNWIELHNFGTAAADISGWQLKDESSEPAFVIPTGTSVAANGYLVLVENLTKFKSQYPDVNNIVGPLGFDFRNSSETLSLLEPNGDLYMAVTYSDTTFFPQGADGLGRTLKLKNPNSNDNLSEGSSWKNGCMGGSPGEAFSPCYQPLVFNELNYKSALTLNTGDWVELRNNTITAINLSGWKLTDQNNTNEFVFPVGTLITAGGYLVVCEDAIAFGNFNPSVTNKVGNFSFGLSGDGEALRLYDAAGVLFLSMSYNDSSPWPLPPDGEGPTLQLSDPNADLNDPASWYSGCKKGTPGTFNSTGLPVAINGNGNSCTGNTKIYSVAPVAGSTYVWTVTGGTIVAGQGTATVQVQWNAGGTGEISVTQTAP